jgi:hypothetical protein
MKKMYALLVGILFLSCDFNKEVRSLNPENWEKRSATISPTADLISGTTYLSVYSQIYGKNEHRTHDLTATISMRNLNSSDTVYVQNARYFDTSGKLIRAYFNKAIYLAPMETVEIVIEEVDREGGTGGNLLFDWLAKSNSNAPYFEGVMISTSGQQGLSFSTQGIRIK